MDLASKSLHFGLKSRWRPKKVFGSKSEIKIKPKKRFCLHQLSPSLLFPQHSFAPGSTPQSLPACAASRIPSSFSGWSTLCSGCGADLIFRWPPSIRSPLVSAPLSVCSNAERISSNSDCAKIFFKTRITNTMKRWKLCLIMLFQSDFRYFCAFPILLST